MSIIRAITISFLSLALCGCVTIDDQLEPRSNVINESTDAARNNSILLNIIRASQSQPLNFVPISKASGTSTYDLKVGLPTLTFGPGQTTAQHQVVLASNSLDNSFQSSFDTAPLETHDFYKNMLSPIDLVTINSLIRQGFSREFVFDALIDSIRIEGLPAALELRNDPFLEESEVQCPSADRYYGDRGMKDDGQNPYSPSSKELFNKYAACEYHRYEFFFQQAMKWGLSIETADVPNPDYSEGAVAKAKAASKEPPVKSSVKTRFCFDTASATADQVSKISEFADRCGGPWPNSKDEKKDLKVIFNNGSTSSPKLKFLIRPRSPAGAFRYFGHLLRAKYKPNTAKLYWRESIRLAGDYRIFDVRSSAIIGCFAHINYFEHSYCVPYDENDGTKQVFAVLAQLVALSTTTGSLPTTLEVRLQ